MHYEIIVVHEGEKISFIEHKSKPVRSLFKKIKKRKKFKEDIDQFDVFQKYNPIDWDKLIEDLSEDSDEDGYMIRINKKVSTQVIETPPLSECSVNCNFPLIPRSLRMTRTSKRNMMII
jgi:hypothetical protein